MNELAVPHRTVAEIEALVGAFEAGTLQKAEFNHLAHMTVAMWYLTRLPYEEAVAAMRMSIKHFAAFHGHDQLYHETITLFWMKVLGHYLRMAGPGLALDALVYRALQRLGSSQLMFSHYSREVLFSLEARQGWVEPDIQPLGFEVTN
jgi:hypothetical protein